MAKLHDDVYQMRVSWSWVTATAFQQGFVFNNLTVVPNHHATAQTASMDREIPRMEESIAYVIRIGCLYI